MDKNELNASNFLPHTLTDSEKICFISFIYEKTHKVWFKNLKKLSL